MTVAGRYLDECGSELERPAIERIARETNVDLNWLLGSRGRDDDPEFVDQGRAAGALENDVAAVIVATLLEAGIQRPHRELGEWSVDGGQVLAEAMRRAVTEVRAWEEWLQARKRLMDARTMSVIAAAGAKQARAALAKSAELAGVDPDAAQPQARAWHAAMEQLKTVAGDAKRANAAVAEALAALPPEPAPPSLLKAEGRRTSTGRPTDS